MIRPSDSAEIPMSYLIKDLAAFAKCGVEVPRVLRTEGVNAASLDPAGFVPLVRYLKLIDLLLGEPQQPGVGLLTGISASLKDHGILGYTMLSSGTLLDAIRAWQRFYALFSWPFEGDFSQTRDEAILTLVEPEHRVYNEPQRVFGIEMWMANWVAAFRDFFGEDNHFIAIDLAYPNPGYADRYHEILHCPVHFNRPASLIRFSREYLSRPIEGANESVKAFCEEQCQQLLADLRAQGNLVDRIRRVLLGRSGQFPSMEDIAYKLNMSERSLRRKLEAQGTSYKDILGDVRMRLAGEYLKTTRMKTQQISDLLGYSEVAAFNRAFKRWYGVPPTTYRSGEDSGEGDES